VQSLSVKLPEYLLTQVPVSLESVVCHRCAILHYNSLPRITVTPAMPPRRCPRCKKVFVRRFTCDRHLAGCVGRATSFSCPVARCSSVFETQARLTHHAFIHDPRYIPYAQKGDCFVCGTHFTNRNSLTVHIGRRHKISLHGFECEVKLGSGGLGLFALVPIPHPGTLLGEYNARGKGVMLAPEQCSESTSTYVYDLPGGRGLDLQTPAARYPFGYINCACPQHATLETPAPPPRGSDAIVFYTRTPIEPGDEVTVYYGKMWFRDEALNIQCAKCQVCTPLPLHRSRRPTLAAPLSRPHSRGPTLAANHHYH
jgi:hypothetical protein